MPSHHKLSERKEMKDALIEKILAKVPSAAKKWADIEEDEDGDGYVLSLRGEGIPYSTYVDHYTVIDGMDSVAEMCLKHESPAVRKVAREISHEQWGKIRVTNKIVSIIIQHGAFGEEL